ncbi:hypothetical protein J008_00953 [Cryptococcus neoformans]|nr:hypothetical protein J008_00953 [Cryptococcus neoformans var. grubii]
MTTQIAMDWTDFHFSQWPKQQDSGGLVPPADEWDPNDVLNTEMFGSPSTPAASSSELEPRASSSNGLPLNISEPLCSDDALFQPYILQSTKVLGGMGEGEQLSETERACSGDGALLSSVTHPRGRTDAPTPSHKPAGEPPLRRGIGARVKNQHVQAVSNTINHVNTGQLKVCRRFDPERHGQSGFDPIPSNASSTSTPSFSTIFNSASQAVQPYTLSSTNINHPPQVPAPESVSFFPEVEEEDPVERLTVRLGEFLFSQKESPKTSQAVDTSTQSEESEWQKKRKTAKDGRWVTDGKTTSENARRARVLQTMMESDGLSNETRNALLDSFLSSPHRFFDMNIPRFRYRMSFTDKRRPALALLNAMYLWATRLSDMPNSDAMERHFLTKACHHLGSATASDDQLMDTIRAAALLSIYMYTRSRYHEGWLIAGVAVRLVLSSGIHQIPSLTFHPPLPEDPLLRNRVHLLSPPKDSTELGERLDCIYSGASRGVGDRVSIYHT